MSKANEPVVRVEIHPNKSVLIDLDDLAKVSAHSWCIAGKGRVRARVSTKRIYLHRFIMSPPSGSVVDHVNGDPLDNRKTNLRICSPAENAKNRSKNKISSSSYKGVRWHKVTARWCAVIKSNGKQYWLGLFKNEKDAALAYDSAARRLHGEFAKTNLAELEKKAEGK